MPHDFYRFFNTVYLSCHNFIEQRRADVFSTSFLAKYRAPNTLNQQSDRTVFHLFTEIFVVDSPSARLLSK